MLQRSEGAARAPADLIILNLVLVFLLSMVAASTYGLYRNTLDYHPEWVSTKPTLIKAVMGAIAYVSLQQALASNRLNLGAWFGFQEVLLHAPLDLTSLHCRFLLEDDGYLHIIYDRRDDGFSGVRFSTRADFPSIWYRATIDGEFVEVDTLSSVGVTAGSWYEVAFGFERNWAVVTIGSDSVGVFAREPGPQQIGFRGGQRNAWVDDVVLRSTNGGAIHESFTNKLRHGTRIATAMMIVLAITLGGVMVGRRWVGNDGRTVGLTIAMAYTVLIIVGGALYTLQYFSGRGYDRLVRGRDRAEQYWIRGSQRDVLELLRAQYPSAVPVGTYRILFLGSSQTLGAGAQVADDVWVRDVERRLNLREGDARYECINAGVSGLIAADADTMLRKDLLEFNPNAVLINLSNNDVDTTTFRESLDSMVRLLDSLEIMTVLLLEPNSLERRVTDSRHGDLAPKHQIVRSVASRYGAAVIDAHSHLADLRDAGFLWWDFAHLTTFGQRLLGEKVHAELRGLLPPAPDPAGGSGGGPGHPRDTDGRDVG